MSSKRLIFDTETCMDGEVYEVSFTIYRGLKLQKSRCFIIYENLDKLLFHNSNNLTVFGKENLDKRHACYVELIKQGKAQIISKHSLEILLNTEFNRIDELLAYNINFDLQALKKTGLNIEHNAKLIDLWLLSLQTVCSSKAYFHFCVINELFTEKHGISTSCQSVLNFYYPDDEHTHFGFEDIVDEWKIFLKIKGLKPNNIKGYNFHHWKISNQYAKYFS